jgi:hypothetical protein
VFLFGGISIALFIAYSIYDIVSWAHLVAVWVFGILAILLGLYWLIAWAHTAQVPKQPLFSEWVYPHDLVYPLLCVLLCLYCAWDMRDATVHNYLDSDEVKWAAALMIIMLIVLVLLSWARWHSPN